MGYATSNGTAKEGEDYVSAVGMLSFAAGETSKSFLILVIDNAFVDGARTVTLTLSNPSGVSLSTQSTAVLTINDNDTVIGANPLDNPQSFVQSVIMTSSEGIPIKAVGTSGLIRSPPAEPIHNALRFTEYNLGSPGQRHSRNN